MISSACFLLLDSVERNTRRHRFVSGLNIEYDANQFGLPGCLCIDAIMPHNSIA
jgi:hypothetical protein